LTEVESRLGQPRAATSRQDVRRKVASWLSVRHSPLVEGAAVLVLYALYETSRGLVDANPGIAVRHADDVVSVERSLHVFVEDEVQQAARAVPGLIGTLGVLYLTLHLAVTGGYLLWLYLRRPTAFPVVRTTLVVASALALIGYLAFPTAPPRLAGIGIADTVSNAHFDLNKGLISALYNPFAAVPSMHVGYAVVIGGSLLYHGGRRALRVLGALYPALVLLVIVATGNHFLLDALAGAAVAGVAATTALLLTQPRRASARRPTGEQPASTQAPARRRERPTFAYCASHRH
jgi:PAP2 superfamily protein